MTRRSSLLMLAVGLVVGAAIGYAAGHRPAVSADPAPVVVAPPSADPPAWLTPLPAGGPLLDTKPAGVSKGMSRALATAELKAGGFEAWADATASDQWERFRKPWHGGYHFVNLRFAGEEVAEVGELWNDP